MIGDQLPDGFNVGATDSAPAITKLRLHDRQHRRSILERKPIVEPFFAPLRRSNHFDSRKIKIAGHSHNMGLSLVLVEPTNSPRAHVELFVPRATSAPMTKSASLLHRIATRPAIFWPPCRSNCSSLCLTTNTSF